jgi:hypothetical protein
MLRLGWISNLLEHLATVREAPASIEIGEDTAFMTYSYYGKIVYYYVITS